MTKTLLNNRYQVIQLLGSGGFGETFLAEDTHLPSRRHCVIKQLKPITNDPQLYLVIQHRFGREAATLESLGEGSEQIPNLYAYFSESGQFYLVQEWIQGQTLADIVATQGRLTEKAVWEILVQLLPVLSYVHSKGIIYRDIKPDNIILRQVNNQPVLIDFGAVKETMATTINTQGKTTSTMVLGTPGFMAPEQAAGRPVYASDIYSLGMTAIYLLTGKLPQELETDPKTEQPLWQEHAFNISIGFAAVLNRATQYRPSDRYTTANKMLEALKAVASNPLTQATTQVISPAVSKTAPQTATIAAQATEASGRQNWQKALILGSLVTVGLLGGALFTGFFRNQIPQSSIATSPATESPAEPRIISSTPAAESFSSPEPTNAPPVASTTPTPTPTPTTEPQTVSSNPTAPPQLETEPQIVPTNPVDSPQPEQSPADPAPQTNNDQQLDDSSSNTTRENIPGFPVGTAESTVKAALGKPTKTSRGVWSNTRAVLYELKPNQISLGYLFDRSSGRLRQTEVSFAQSVEPEVMQAMLQEMLGERTSDNISQGLQQIYQRRTNKYSFNTNGLEGVIERNQRDRIYIGVWDADLH